MRSPALACLLAAAACSSSSSSSTDAPPAAVDAPPGGADAKPTGADAGNPDAAGNLTTLVSGTLEAMTFAAMDAIANDQTGSGFDFNGPATYVVVSTFANACDKQATSTGVPNGKLLIFALSMTDIYGVSAAATQTGDYTVVSSAPAPGTKSAEVFYERDGSDCLKAASLQADSGTVTLSQASGRIEGTFDLHFGTEHVTGSFSAPTCGALNVNRTPLGGC